MNAQGGAGHMAVNESTSAYHNGDIYHVPVLALSGRVQCSDMGRSVVDWMGLKNDDREIF